VIHSENYAAEYSGQCHLFLQFDKENFITLGYPFLHSFPMKLQVGASPKMSFWVPKNQVKPDHKDESGPVGAIFAIILVTIAILGSIAGFWYYRKRQRERDHPYTRTLVI